MRRKDWRDRKDSIMANPATLIEVKNYFGYDSPTAFAKDWKQLSDEDKAQLKAGIGDGTLTY